MKKSAKFPDHPPIHDKQKQKLKTQGVVLEIKKKENMSAMQSVLFDDESGSMGNEAGANWFLDSTADSTDDDLIGGAGPSPSFAPSASYHVAGGNVADFSNEPPLLEG